MCLGWAETRGRNRFFFVCMYLLSLAHYSAWDLRKIWRKPTIDRGYTLLFPSLCYIVNKSGSTNVGPSARIYGRRALISYLFITLWAVSIWPAAQLLCFLLRSCAAHPSQMSGRYEGIKNRCVPSLECGCNNCRVFWLHPCVQVHVCEWEAVRNMGKCETLKHFHGSHRIQIFFECQAHIAWWCTTWRRLDLHKRISVYIEDQLHSLLM